MKRKIWYLGSLAIFAAVLLIPVFALADGMIIRPHDDRWDYDLEANQEALINYENGTEKMILSIGLENSKNDQLWLVPLPSEPEKVAVDVIESFPRLSGEDVFKKAKANVVDIRKVLSVTQFYPLPFINWYSQGVSYDGGVVPMAAVKESATDEQDITVYEHIEKEGITSEIITAKTANGLYDYLKSKNLKIEKGSIPVIDNYIGKDFSFVASWLSPQNLPTPSPTPIPPEEESNGAQKTTAETSIIPPYYSPQRGLSLTFNTDKIYFPLLPTSVYGSETVPATIRVLGFVTPEIYKDIENYTTTKYYLQESRYVLQDFKNFYNGDYSGSLKYTKIEIKAPSKFLTADLWINNTPPANASYATFMARSGWNLFFLGVALLLIASYLTAVLVGLILFKGLRNKKIFKFGLSGLFNLFTLIGLIIAVVFWPTKEVKSEDQQLFEEIKKRGFSTAALRTRDWRKLIFVPAFSLLFLFIVWALTKLIELTL